MTTPVSDEDLRLVLAILIAAADAGKPITGTELSKRIGMARASAFHRRDLLLARGWITVVAGNYGARRLVPTAEARALDLPPPPARAEAPPQPRLKSRPCMRCGVSISSEGAHHRHCSACRRHLTEAEASARYAP